MNSMKKVQKEARLNELQNIDRQISYYHDLVCQMKRKVSPPTLPGFCYDLNK